MKTLALVSAAIATAALTACTSSNGAPGQDHIPQPTRADALVTIHGTSALRFRPSTITVSAKTFRVRFIDTSSYPHNLRVPALHFTSRTVDGEIGGTKSTTFTLRFPHPGTYPFLCTYHSAAGMRGKFIVRAAAG